MTEPTKRQLLIANMTMQKDLAQAQKRIREQDKRIAKLERDQANVYHAAQHLAKLATP